MSQGGSAEVAGDTQYDLSNPDVCTKYRTAGEIVGKVLKQVLEQVKEGADIYEMCALGDKLVMEETGKLYNKRVKDAEWEKLEGDKKKNNPDGRKVEKGIAFPTCVCVNEIAGNFSPISKTESRVLRSGDVVKVEVGCHLDGYIAQLGHTVICPDEGGAKLGVQDRRADVVKACWTAAEVAVRLLQPGNTNTQITEALEKCGEEFKCQPVPGVLSHQLKRHVIDGEKCILGKENVNDEQKVDEFQFGLNEAYTLDLVFTSGDGKLKETECRSTVFKRAPDNNYILKTSKGRQFIGEVGRRFPSLPFSLSMISDEQCARVGVSEAKRHELLHEYSVMTERQGEFIASFKFTVLILPGGTKKVADIPLLPAGEQSPYSLDPQYQVEDEGLLKILATSTKKNKRNKKKKEGEAEA